MPEKSTMNSSARPKVWYLAVERLQTFQKDVIFHKNNSKH